MLPPPPDFDDVLHEWLHTIISDAFSAVTLAQRPTVTSVHGDTLPTLREAAPTIREAAPPITPPRLNTMASRVPAFTPPMGHPPSEPVPPQGQSGPGPYVSGMPPPPPDMWAQIAANLTHGIASVAAVIQPAIPTASLNNQALSYEGGGKEYDEFQVAVLRGFAHSHNIADIPAVWQMFQYTKHIETHRDNIKREMVSWAKNAQPDQVPIDRGVFFPNSVMKDILALRFNPGGPIAEAVTADQGLSILICHPRTTEGKAAMRRREQLEATYKQKTVAEAELDISLTSPLVFPDSFHELHGCIRTYCALLHTLFRQP